MTKALSGMKRSTKTGKKKEQSQGERLGPGSWQRGGNWGGGPSKKWVDFELRAKCWQGNCCIAGRDSYKREITCGRGREYSKDSGDGGPRAKMKGNGTAGPGGK